ncbi:hypothetical protein CEY00_Acc24333 [Actinidia chinensis var. chinensis]|uniref:Uncharacterized protein n=1 Tax=Actinidia chinensis var. chinensis TaxID=1590841 RepID=A0A2R6Q1U4_ACTCC|nr:hypothetical protein CEY00_Acc24333 [Actinidia chinensis var. chinensis]
MGSCLSKKTTIGSSSSAIPDPPDQTKTNPQITQVTEKKKAEEENVKKEIFLIKHRKSHEIDREEKPKPDPKPFSPITSGSEAADANNINLVNGGLPNGGIVVRTSSCSKEEIDAILIQCGRLSRNSSTRKSAGGGRKYSGSKRSYDFDQETGDCDVSGCGGGEDTEETERVHRHRELKPGSSSSRRRTPSREREQQQQQRSGSRERGSGGGGRRVSRSPARRSESPITGNNICNEGSARPGKMVSVPATVSNNGIGGGGGGENASGIKRISVKRNVGEAVAAGCRSVASPRSRSPARGNLRAANENQNGHNYQQPPSLSRSNSRKAEQSPCRRNPLAEIDQNCILSQAPLQKPNTENVKSNKVTVQGIDNKTIAGKSTTTMNSRVKEQQPAEDNEGKGGLQPMAGNVAVTVVPSGVENPKPQAVTRSRSSRLSRDLDLNPETLLNPLPSSYTALLLEDIQNFHHKTTTPTISLPACVSKACSIVEAVADLNSTTISNLSEQFGKKRLVTKDPFLESEVFASDDLMEPSFHKYVTVSRGTAGDEGDMEELEIESSGSNSFVGGQHSWVSPSSLEPNSADSVDCWTSSRLSTDERTPPSFPKKREFDHLRSGIGRGRVGSGRGLHSTPTLAAAST